MNKNNCKQIGNEQYFKQLKLKDCIGNSYLLFKNENYEKFLEALGVDKTTITKAVLLKPVVSLKFDSGEYTIKQVYPEGQVQKLKFILHRTLIKLTPGGRIATSVFEVKKNKLIEKQNISGRQIIITREFGNRTLVVTMEMDKIKCVRHYKLTTSRHSIQTETSRRNSLFKIEVVSETNSSRNDESSSYNSNSTERDVSVERMCV